MFVFRSWRKNNFCEQLRWFNKQFSDKTTRKRFCLLDKQLFIGKIKDLVVKSVAKNRSLINDSVNEVTIKQKIYKWKYD